MLLPTSVAAYLRNEFIASFVSESNPKNWEPSDDKGVWGITLICLTYWNAAAGLSCGKAKASALETTAFMADRLAKAPAPFGQRYRDRVAIIYALFRHGLVHHRFPGELAASGSTISWVIGRDLQDGEHLLLVGPLPVGKANRAFGALLHGPPFSGQPRSYIGLNPDLLYEHSLKAFEEFALACENDPLQAQTVQNGIRAAKLPRVPQGKNIGTLIDAALGAPDPWPQP